MAELNDELRALLQEKGAATVGFGDLTGLPAAVREGLPRGVSVAVRYPAAVIRGIHELPTAEYFDWYSRLNAQLDDMVTAGAEWLAARGYTAVAQTRARVGAGEKEDSTRLPHKTVATRAGLGWIGRSALFVTKEYGSMIRLSSILTDAPLAVAVPVDMSLCGTCAVCVEACPAGAISGESWVAGMPREALFDHVKCRAEARARSVRGFGKDVTVCGKCIAVCPHTQKRLRNIL